MKPTDLPELRDRQLAYYRTDLALPRWRETNKVGFFDDDRFQWNSHDGRFKPTRVKDVGRATFDMEVERWRRGEMFFVSEEMGEVAKSAAETMPAYELRVEDLPSPAGIMVFDGDVLGMSTFDDHAAAIRCATWGPMVQPAHPDSAENGLQLYEADGRLWAVGVWLAFYTHAQEVLPMLYPDDPATISRRTSALPPFLYDGEAALWCGDGPITQRYSAGHIVNQLLVRCTWLLMQQRVVSMSDVTLPRPARRRLARSPEPLTRTRVIQLRGAESVPDREPGQSARDYVHRWFVRGHWRQQWYPSEERHKPIWVNPYIKGPDGAPILGGEKVYAWTR